MADSEPAAIELSEGGIQCASPTDCWVAPRRWTAADVLAARSTATWCARVILDGEIGGFGYDPYRDGSQGEKGPAQLHPRGKLPTFYAAGWTDPHSPWQAVPFLEDQLQRGQGFHWSTAPRGCR